MKKKGIKAKAVPNPDLKIQFPGMKNLKDKVGKSIGDKKNLGAKRDDLIPIMKARKGTKYNNNIPEVDGVKPTSHCQATGKLSAYQRRTHKNFMKVRLGETHEKWLHRTRFRRMLSPEELQTVKHKKKQIRVVIGDTPKRRSRIKYQKILDKQIIIQLEKKDYGFLRNLPLIMGWASAKYDIANYDLQIGLLFYNNSYPFTQEQFDKRLCILPSPQRNFARFKRLGYLKEIKNRRKYFEKEIEYGTGLYLLSASFNKAIDDVYNKITLLGAFENIGNPINYQKKNLKTKEEQDIFAELKKMHAEFMDILQGIKEPERIEKEK
jgi:hypothetical protein